MTTPGGFGTVPPDMKGALTDAPIDELTKLAEEYGAMTVPVYIKERNTKGHHVTHPSTAFTIGDLMTEAIAEHLRETYGGGMYLVEPRNPHETTQRLTKPWWITVVGPRKIATSESVSRGAPSYPEMATGLRAGFVPTFAGQTGVRPSDVMTYTSDAIAVEQLREAREENKKLKNEAANRERQFTQRMEAMGKQLQDMQLAQERQRMEAREAAMQAANDAKIARLEQLIQQRNSEQPKPSLDLVGMFSAFAPIVIAMINASKDSQQLQLTAQQKASEQQTTTMMALLKRPEENPIKTMLELAVPLMTTLGPKLLEAFNPSKQADLIATMGQNQMEMLSLAAQAMRELAPEADTPMMQFAKAVVDGVTSIAERTALAQQQAQQQSQLIQHQPPRVIATAPVSVPPPAQVEQLQTNGTGRQTRQAPPQLRNAREIAQAIVSDQLWPAELKTPFWNRLLTTLHSYERDPEIVGQEIARMLEGMAKVQQLPASVMVMFEDGGPRPSTVLQHIFAPLPIAQDPEQHEFYKAVLVTIDSSYIDAGDDVAEDDETDDEIVEMSAQAPANGEIENESEQAEPA